MAASELGTRVGVAAVGIPLAIWLIYLGGWPLGLALALIAAIGATEMFGLAEAVGILPYRPLGAALAAALVAFAVAHGTFTAASPYLLGAMLTASIGMSLGGLWLRAGGADPLASASITLFGAAYVGGGLAFGSFLRSLDPATSSSLGAALLAYPLTVAWIGDSAAYFCGRKWGRRKLSPTISPNKTVVGAIAGFAGSVIAGAMLGGLVFDLWLGVGVGYAVGGLGGALIAPAAQLGDLAESQFKRHAGVKDSGRIFPGHGGVLDRFDALLPSLPIAWVFMTVIVPMLSDVPWR